MRIPARGVVHLETPPPGGCRHFEVRLQKGETISTHRWRWMTGSWYASSLATPTMLLGGVRTSGTDEKGWEVIEAYFEE